MRVFQLRLVISLDIEKVFIFSGGVEKLPGMKAWILGWHIFVGLDLMLIVGGIDEWVEDFGKIELVARHLG